MAIDLDTFLFEKSLFQQSNSAIWCFYDVFSWASWICVTFDTAKLYLNRELLSAGSDGGTPTVDLPVGTTSKQLELLINSLLANQESVRFSDIFDNEIPTIKIGHYQQLHSYIAYHAFYISSHMRFM